MSVWVNKVNRISVSVWGCAVWKNFPAMAYARPSAGPAGRPGACISQIPCQLGCRTSISRHFLFENRSLVDFTERNWRPWGRSWWKWLFYLKEIGFAFDRCGSRGYFFFENASLINFQIGNEGKREFRAAEMRFYLHKEFCAAGIRFLSTQRIGGGDLEENGHFL